MDELLKNQEATKTKMSTVSLIRTEHQNPVKSQAINLVLQIEVLGEEKAEEAKGKMSLL